MIDKTLDRGCLDRLVSFLNNNMPLPRQSKDQTTAALDKLLQQLNWEIHVNLIGMTPEERKSYKRGLLKILCLGTSFRDYLFLIRNEFSDDTYVQAERRFILEGGINLKALMHENLEVEDKRYEICEDCASLFETTILTHKLWKVF